MEELIFLPFVQMPRTFVMPFLIYKTVHGLKVWLNKPDMRYYTVFDSLEQPQDFFLKNWYFFWKECVCVYVQYC